MVKQRVVHKKRLQQKPKHLEGFTNEQGRTHGKPWMYKKKVCWPACFDCWDAARKDRKKIVYRRDTGLSQSRVDVGPTQKQIRQMVDLRGWTIRFIADQVGCHMNTIRRLYRLDSETGYTLSGLANKITELHTKKISYTNTRYRNMMDPTLARAAIQGLMRQGWSQEWIANNASLDKYAVSRIVAPKHTTYIKRETNDKLVQLAIKTGSDVGPHNLDTCVRDQERLDAYNDAR